MLRTSLVVWGLAGGLLLCGQEATLFDRAAPDVDAALRARVSKFYEAHKEGKWREADSLVHDDSKDAFFEADKTRIKSFEIRKITYDENFTRASVLVMLPFDMLMPGVGIIENAPRPVTSKWKIEDGEWWWYVEPYDPCKPVSSPIGMVQPRCIDGKPVAQPKSNESSLAGQIQGRMVSLEQVQNQVKASKDKIQMSIEQPSQEQVTISNSSPGPAMLALESSGELRGLTATLDKTEIAPGETATLTVSYDPPSATVNRDYEYRVRVQPFNAVLPVTVQFVAAR